MAVIDDVGGPPRTVLVLGSAGAGTTTIAAALAVDVARAGHKTLLLSSSGPDLARLLGEDGDLGGTDLDGEPTELEPGLYGRRLTSTHPSAEESTLREQVRAVLDSLGLDADLDDLLRWGPLGDVLLLLTLRHHLLDGRWDAVVVDLGPADRALTVLATPDLVLDELQRALPVGRRVDRAIRAGTEGVQDPVLAQLPTVEAELRALRQTLEAPAVSTHVVMAPHSRGLAGTRRALAGLALCGFAAAGVVVNRVVPAPENKGAADLWRTEVRAAQLAVVEAARREFARPFCSVQVAVHCGAEPDSLTAVAALAESLGPPLAADLVRARHPRGWSLERVDDCFEMTLPLPVVARADLDLSRDGDDLVLTLPWFRRTVRLPSVLRRCEVIGARLRAERLVVTFRPDPGLWRSQTW